MGLYEIARQVFPGWVSRPPRKHWGLFVDAVALTIDALVELADLGIAAARPGQVEGLGSGVLPLGDFLSVDALPLIGEQRMVARGLTENAADYAARLRRYRDDWHLAGTVFGLLDQVAGVLTTSGSLPPRLRIFTLTGRWYTREPDGTLRYQTHEGDGFQLTPAGACSPDATVAVVADWDSLADPHPPGWGDQTRFFLVVYCPTNLPYLATISGLVGDGRTIGMDRGTNDAATLGTCAPIEHVELVRGVVQERRCVGYRCGMIIHAFDGDSFAPDGSSGETPDGTWGWPCKVVGGEMVPARDLTARYGRAEPGGIAGT